MTYRLIGPTAEIAGTGGVDGFSRCTADGHQHIGGVWNRSACSRPMAASSRSTTTRRQFALPPAPCRPAAITATSTTVAGTHPLQCWNGELPGTLPMVCGVAAKALGSRPWSVVVGHQPATTASSGRPARRIIRREPRSDRPGRRRLVPPARRARRLAVLRRLVPRRLWFTAKAAFGGWCYRRRN
jgi:hypothetical protein